MISVPVLLKTFLNWDLLGERVLTGKLNITIGIHTMYCMKTKRLINYLLSDDNNTSFKKQVANFDQLVLGLAIHQYTRNKNVVDLFR